MSYIRQIQIVGSVADISPSSLNMIVSQSLPIMLYWKFMYYSTAVITFMQLYVTKI